MPGIAGIVSRKPARECESVVDNMVASLLHEPFYAAGTHSVPELGVYAGWAVHENSFASSQPFWNEEENVALILSGECFPQKEVASRLKRNGHQFSDEPGDWLVHFYEEAPDAFFAKLNGLFSGLLIDRRQKKVFLFNDRYGLERIYWHETSDTIYFASEAKALLQVLPQLRAFDEQGVAQFLAFGCTLKWRTLFREVHLLPGASVWLFQSGKSSKSTYFSPQSWENQSTLPADAFEREFAERFSRILPAYFDSALKPGISLTGGLDTRRVMVCRPQFGQAPICYTFDGVKGATLDARIAARVAAAAGLEHRIVRIAPDFFSDFASQTDRTVYTTDGCFGITGAHEIYLNKHARQLAPLRLTGNYGSEILRGVSTFKQVALSPQLITGEVGSLVSFWSQQPSSEHPVTFAVFREIPWNLFGSLAASRSQVTFRTPYLDNDIVRLTYQAPQSVRESSFPGWRFVKENNTILAKIPTDRRQSRENAGRAAFLKRFLSEVTFKFDYLNNDGWPDWLGPVDPIFRRVASSLHLIGQHKYLHYRSWFRHELAEYVKSGLQSALALQTPFWNRTFVERMAADHISGRKNYVREINAVLTLEVVQRLLLGSSCRSREAKRAIAKCNPA
jgi:asparagine synthase (glutamine-hydrolysing)